MRKLGATVLGLIACLLLGGCWTSEKLLLDRHHGSGDLRAGIYDGGTDATRVVPRGDGWYIISNGGETSDKAAEEAMPLFLTHLGGATAGTYAFAAGDHSCLGHEDTCQGWTYGLMSIKGGEIRAALPGCANTEALAKRWGGVIKSSSGEECIFDKAGPLHQALVEYAHGAGAFEQVYKRR